MKIENKAPFEEWICYLNLHPKMGRWQVCLYNPDTSKHRTILYSKFKMSVKLGRVLRRDEEVDHKDGDKSNDADDNLQILTRENHVWKTNLSKYRKMVTLICPYCSSQFTIERRQTHLIRGGNPTCCSRPCGARQGRKLSQESTSTVEDRSHKSRS